MKIDLIIIALLNMISGIGIFVIACSMMSSNLEALSSNKLKNMFSKISNNKWIGVGIGTVGTAAIQSSGAMMVMIIGFVNAEIMSLVQATTIMYGSDIGTTITGQIVALGLAKTSAISTTVIFSALTGLGVVITAIGKKDIVKKIGGIFSGFGMLFVGLNMMSNAMGSFAELDGIKIFLAGISNPVLLAIIGAVMTAIVQSSSVMTSLSITMVFAGLISIDQGIYLTMGANIGSCVVGVVAALTSGTNAKRTSFIQLIYNIGGVVLFMIVGEILRLVSNNGVTYGTILQSIMPNSPEAQLAMFHTMFNVLSAILCIPLTEHLVKLSINVIPNREEQSSGNTEHLKYIDIHMLKTPSIAVEQVKKEICYMAEQAMNNFNLAIDSIISDSILKIDDFEKTENNLNCINHELTSFVSDLSRIVVNENDNKYLSKTYHSIIDFERIGDYAENIIEYAQELVNNKEKFSNEAKQEIITVSNKVISLYRCVMNAYINNDDSNLFEASLIEDEIDDLTSNMDMNHIDRLSNGKCTPSIGAKFISLASDIERIADHIINVAKTIKTNIM